MTMCDPTPSRAVMALRRARIFGASALAILTLASCAPEARPSTAGETCGRTADCIEPLRCVDAVCTAPGKAKRLIDRRGPDGRPPNSAARIPTLRALPVPDGAQPAAGSGLRALPRPTAAPNARADAPAAGSPPATQAPPAGGTALPPSDDTAGAPPLPDDENAAPPAGPGGR